MSDTTPVETWTVPACLTPMPAPLAEAPGRYPTHQEDAVQVIPPPVATVSLGHRPADPGYFYFDETVAPIFDDMARRSIPGYAHFWDIVATTVSRRGLPEWSQVWDMGVSTGAGLEAVRRGVHHPYASYYGIDISQPMLDQAHARCPYAELSIHDLRNGLPPGLTKGKLGAVVWGWTLQFLDDMLLRRELLKECAYALAPGGMIFVGEKYRLEDPEDQKINQDAYIAWRLGKGYTITEIEAKTTALKAAMHPWTHSDLVRTAEVLNLSIRPIYRRFNFGGYVLYRA